MDDQDSEKKSEIWLKYCEALVKSKIVKSDESPSDGCCELNKEDSLNP